MIDLKKDIVAALTEILPTYYENAAGPDTQKPCITYVESLNADDATGDTFGYSRVRYTIKVWGHTWDTLTPYCLAIDTAMRGIGFTRSGAFDLSIASEIEKVMDYDALCIEQFEN